MPGQTAADTIRILVSTDNHVGYHERDHIRGNDSAETFDEIMGLAREHDVDMVLLAGDLFHDNKPSRKAMYQVLRSLRKNCLGDKPCELEMLSDASENFQGAFNHVNYEDPDINVAIPIFSIHGNHDDPSGEGHLAALDLLQISGMMNYYGRTPESDNIHIKPVLLQKGRTKLALYGMSNVRDERLFRTFRDGGVKFFQPGQQKDEWFNLMSVHQNHHAHTETGYLPENFLPDFLDLVVWGHEHECLIEPRYNPEMSFHVMQPGSSVATSLMPGEAVSKRVAILKVTGKDFQYEPITLKTVRPFIMREIVMSNEKEMKAIAKKSENRTEITRYLMKIIDEMIEEADQQWRAAQDDLDDDDDEANKPPLPLIRLRIEYSAPDGGRYDVENPQRFSSRFTGKVANVSDVVQFYKKKTAQRKNKNETADLPEAAALAQMDIEAVHVEKIVREFLAAQSLTILPQNSFGDAVSQFVDKDDKHAMEVFVNDSLTTQVKHLLGEEDMGEEDVVDAMDKYRSKMEDMFAAGHVKRPKTKRKTKPKPEGWDTDLDGEWEDQPGSIEVDGAEASNQDDDEDLSSMPVKSTTTRGRGRGRATTTRGGASTRGKTAAKAAAKPPARASRAKRTVVEDDDDDEIDDDILMIDDAAEDDDDDDESQSQSQSQSLFVRQSTKPAPKKATAKAAPARALTSRSTTRQAATAKQSTLNFSQSQAPVGRSAASGPVANGKKLTAPAVNVSDDEISDDDAFETPAATTRSSTRRR